MKQRSFKRQCTICLLSSFCDNACGIQDSNCSLSLAPRGGEGRVPSQPVYKPLRFGGCTLVQRNSSYRDGYKHKCLNSHNCLDTAANRKTCFHSAVTSFDAKKTVLNKQMQTTETLKQGRPNLAPKFSWEEKSLLEEPSIST